MAEVELSHQALLADIAAADGDCFWWMGQHSFILKLAGRVLYLDPFFDPWESRCTPPLLAFAELANADLVLVTHDHGDHLSPDSLRALAEVSPAAQFISPRTAAERMHVECGVPSERLHPLTAGERAALCGVRVTAIKGKHELFGEHPELGYPWLGYVIEAGGLTLYHAGDTIMYEGLLTTLRAWPRLDVAFLPINGRDAERYRRNIMGNMTFQEAAELAGELRVGLAVPAHYDMFVGNQEDPEKFVRFLEAKYPGVPSWVGPAGRRVPIRAGG